MRFEPTAARLWKKLSREERTAAAAAFWKETPPEVAGPALAALVQARHMRPQVARSLPPEEQARALASVLNLGEPVAASLLVALHLGERRPMLAVFLDAAGLAHDNGVLKDDEGGDAAVGEAAARKGVEALRAAGHTADQVRTYLNTLWLQDPDRWKSLEALPEAE
jgi:hypothetical protein